MNTVIANLIFVSLLWFGSGVGSSLICPPSCACESTKNGYFNVNCASLGLKKPINPNELPANTSKLDLSHNEIETIRNYAFKAINQTKIKWLILYGNGLKMIEPKAFAGLNKLMKIDLSQNQLTSLPGDVFKDLKNVKNIDLSKNRLFVINKTQFHGLKKLRNINLSSNKLSILPDGLFSSLDALKKIDLQSNRIICDCNLKWTIKWVASVGRRQSILGRCEYPLALKGTKIGYLTRKETVCGKLQLPVMAFGPQGDQIAFKGDSYTFECIFSWIPNTQITWFKDNQLIPVEPKGNHRNIVLKFDPDQVVLASVLDIKQLNIQDSGHYRCNVSYPGGYQHIRTSRLSIIPSDAPYCQAATTETDRGTFHWHNTAAGGAAFLPCPVGVISSLSHQRGLVVMARRRCSLKGVWMDVEAQPCIHTNEITRALHDLKEKSVNDTTVSVSSVSKQLLIISKRAKEFSHPLDVVYAAEVVDNLAHAIGDHLTFNELVSSVSNIMETDAELLLQAQRRFKACSSMVLSLDSVHTRVPLDVSKSMSFVSKNIAVSLVRVTPSDVVGKICYVTTGTNSSFKEIGCLMCKNYTSCERQMQAVDTSIYLPSSLFQHISVDVDVQFQLIVFSNSILFPEITKRETGPSAEVTSSVVSAQFRGMALTNLTQPVIFKFRNHQDGKQPIPVYWDLHDNDGRGNWKKNEDCGPVLSQDNNTLMTTCFQSFNKNFIAVMTNVSKPEGAGDTRSGERNFHRGVMELIVFVGAGIASLLLLTTLVVYAVIRELRFDRDDAAMLMNQCLALIVAIVLFVTGINHVTNVLVCRSVGVLLHYFLLCTLLWIGCSGICLHRLIRIAIQPEEYNPVLRYYMMSWGIPLIICGITIAGNLENYQVQDYCWLRLNPFYGAFLGPACLIIFIDLIIFLRLWNLIKSIYDTETSSQTASEGEAETAAEENALVIQQEPSASGEENAESVDTSALPDKGEMTDLLRGNLVILLLFILNVTLGIMLVRYQHSRTLYIALSCLFAMALVILGVAVFIFHCYRKGKIRSLWDKRCFNCRCLRRKRYELQQEIPEVETVEETPEDKTTANTANGDAGQFTGEEIHGAKNLLSLGDGDSASNVSLPSSAAITLDKQVVQLPEKEPESQVEKASSVSDKQSWASAPLPSQYKPRGKLLKNPPGYRHSYTENERATPTIAEYHKAPLAPPEGTASSVASSVQLPTDTASNIAASEGPSSVRDAVEAANVSRNTNTSCSASEVSIPIDIPTLKKRPPIPGSSSHSSEVAPPIPFKKPHQPAPAVRENPAVTRPTPTTQELIDQYSIPAATTSNIPRQIPRDHVVVRERYHIPYEPRALSEKPRDHYQILPLPTNARDHYLLQPGHDQYEDPRGQHLIPNPHNQYQVAPEHFAIPGDQNARQLTRVPSPTHARPHDYYHLPCDTIPSPRAHDLYQMARDLASPRSNDSHQASHEQNPGRGQHDHSPGQRTHEQNQVPSDHIRPTSPNHNYISHEPCFGPRSPDHSQVSHDSSVGQRSHDHYQVPRDYMARVQHHADRPYENIPAPSEQSSLQRTYERNAPSLGENEPSRDQPQTPNMTNDIVHGPTHEGLERSHDQYAGEGPREQPQAVNVNEKSSAGDQRPGLPLDKNGVGVRPQNAASGTREQPKGIHVSRRRSRNPYQIARDIHNNLGIETRPRDRQSRRAQRAPPAEQSSQPVKTYGQLQVSSPVETPKERTPRSSMSSWKEDRPKASKKEWASDMPKTAVFVPIPHLKRGTPEPPRNETSV